MLAKVLIYMILFFVVASPATFKFMRRMLGGWVASAEGVPHATGLLLHSAVYVLLACYLPAKLVSGFAEDYEDEKYAEEYIGEYGSTRNPMGLSDATRQEAGNPGSIY
jgi:hypothetical protein